jgi:hypothetical protein
VNILVKTRTIISSDGEEEQEVKENCNVKAKQTNTGKRKRESGNVKQINNRKNNQTNKKGKLYVCLVLLSR